MPWGGECPFGGEYPRSAAFTRREWRGEEGRKRDFFHAPRRENGGERERGVVSKDQDPFAQPRSLTLSKKAGRKGEKI